MSFNDEEFRKETVTKAYRAPLHSITTATNTFTQSACNLPLAYYKYVKEHNARKCTKPYNEWCNCINYGQIHPANCRNCLKFPKICPKKSKNI